MDSRLQPHHMKKRAKITKKKASGEEDETRSEMLVKREFSAERMLAKTAKKKFETEPRHTRTNSGEANLLTEKFHV